MTTPADYIEEKAALAKEAFYTLSAAEGRLKNAALLRLADLVSHHRTALAAANAQDLDNARAKGLDAALTDRLKLTPVVIDGIIESLRQIAALPDPVGEMDGFCVRPNGLRIGKMRVPLGLVGIIYESRPNVTTDAAALCLKSGNACLLRGGSEAFHSNLALSRLITQALRESGLPEHAVVFVENTDRESVGAMLQSTGLIDVVIPRGGRSLVERVSREARVPVIKHLDGICHVYIDRDADAAKALDIAYNAKTSRYGTCNTMETLLVHHSRAAEILPPLAERYDRAGVELRGCHATRSVLPHIRAATEEDWRTEYLAPVLSVRVVSGLTEAVGHINRYGSHHTDSIVTESYTRANRFLRTVDSASVMVNASTRLANGFACGLGAEIGNSSDNIHARGPVGLEGLTGQKWIVLGDGQIRQ